MTRKVETYRSQLPAELLTKYRTYVIRGPAAPES